MAFESVVKEKRYDDDVVHQTEKPTTVPEHLIFEVLSWLPVKSVARFRCLSKSWYDLIKNNEYFHRINLNHINTNFMIIVSLYTWGKPGFYTVDYTTKNIKEFSYPRGIKYDLTGLEYAIRVVSSINGLLFLRYALGEDTKTAIWNPLSERYQEMLCPGLDSSIGLKPMITFGFGYEKTTKDYKVVALVNHQFNRKNRAGDYQAWIYSLKLNTWKRLEIFSHAIDPQPEHKQNGVFCNGALHWMIVKEKEKESCFLGCEILRFDLVDEKFDKVALPINNCCSLSVLDDCLCVTKRKILDNDGIQIWVMNKNGNTDSLSWSMMINLDHCNLQTFIREYHSVKPLLYLVKREVVVFISQSYTSTGETIFLYDLINQSIEILYVAPKRSNIVVAFPYMETLELL